MIGGEQMARRQHKLFFQIVNAIIVCSILITCIVSVIILNNSMYNVTEEAKEKFQYLVSDHGHQIDIRITSSEKVINELGSFISFYMSQNQYFSSAEKQTMNSDLINILSTSARKNEYVYDYFIYLNTDENDLLMTSDGAINPDEDEYLIHQLNLIDIHSARRGKWINFSDGKSLFHYIEPLVLNGESVGCIGGRYRQNSFLWGLYDSEDVYSTDTWLIDPVGDSIVMNHSLPGKPITIDSSIINRTNERSQGVFELKQAGQEDLIISFSHLRNQWLVMVGAHKRSILSRSYALINMLIMLIIIGTIFSIFIASSISERIVDPIDMILTEIKRISNGDLLKPIPSEFMQYENEIGYLAMSIDDMRISLKRYISEIEHHAQHLENEVFYQTAELLSTNEQLQYNIEQMKIKDTALTQSNAELEQTLENLKETQNELVKSQKLAALSSLVRGVSHKLNTPVGTSITTLSYLIQELRAFFVKVNEESGSLKAYHEDMYDLVDTANLTMTNLMKTRDILDTLKDITSDAMTEKKHMFHLSRMMEEMISTMRVRSEYRDYKMNLDMDPDIWINSYPSVFTQVISHLISNSVIHGFKESKDGTIDVSMHLKELYVEIIYTDNGRGISAEAIDKIFDPFYTTDLGAGTSGLGLSVIYNQINLKLGGSIICDRTFVDGTRFKIRIPST